MNTYTIPRSRYVLGPTGTGSFLPKFSYHETWHVAIIGLTRQNASSTETQTQTQTQTQMPRVIGHRISNIGRLDLNDSTTDAVFEKEEQEAPEDEAVVQRHKKEEKINDEDYGEGGGVDGGRVRTGTFSR